MSRYFAGGGGNDGATGSGEAEVFKIGSSQINKARHDQRIRNKNKRNASNKPYDRKTKKSRRAEGPDPHAGKAPLSEEARERHGRGPGIKTVKDKLKPSNRVLTN